MFMLLLVGAAACDCSLAIVGVVFCDVLLVEMLHKRQSNDTVIPTNCTRK